jgi:hypothetical protein
MWLGWGYGTRQQLEKLSPAVKLLYNKHQVQAIARREAGMEDVRK